MIAQVFHPGIYMFSRHQAQIDKKARYQNKLSTATSARRVALLMLHQDPLQASTGALISFGTACHGSEGMVKHNWRMLSDGCEPDRVVMLCLESFQKRVFLGMPGQPIKCCWV